jgi:hypothetical protein
VDILINGLHAWLMESPLDQQRYPRCYHQLIKEQDAIGWRQVFNGHITKQWRLGQDKFIRQQKIQTIVHTQEQTGCSTL